MFYCCLCGLPTDSEERLQRHLAVCSNTPPLQELQCRACRSVFPGQEELSNHQQDCNIFRPYRCE